MPAKLTMAFRQLWISPLAAKPKRRRGWLKTNRRCRCKCPARQHTLRIVADAISIPDLVPGRFTVTNGVLVSRVLVSGAGAVRQRVSVSTQHRRLRVCTADEKAGQAGPVILHCKLSDAARRRLHRGSLRLRAYTTFAPAGPRGHGDGAQPDRPQGPFRCRSPLADESSARATLRSVALIGPKQYVQAPPSSWRNEYEIAGLPQARDVAFGPLVAARSLEGRIEPIAAVLNRPDSHPLGTGPAFVGTSGVTLLASDRRGPDLRIGVSRGRASRGR